MQEVNKTGIRLERKIMKEYLSYENEDRALLQSITQKNLTDEWEYVIKETIYGDFTLEITGYNSQS